MSQEELASNLRWLEDQMDAQRQTCDRTHMDVLRTKYALGKAERAADQAYLQCQSAFATLHLLEGSIRTLRDGFPDVVGGGYDYHLVNVTDEEIRAGLRSWSSGCMLTRFGSLTSRLPVSPGP